MACGSGKIGDILISIIVPCYNCENTLKRCADSILNQTCPDFEVILVNDGSTDGTAQMCDQLQASDERVRVIHQKNAGLMAAWKRGVRESAGEYITFSDSDDWLEADLIERLYAVIKEEEPDVITYGIRTDYSDGSFLYLDNYIQEGLYLRDKIEKEIFPRYFFNNKMGTMAILPARQSKAVKREIFLNNMDILRDCFSIGEDDIASFIVLLDAQTIYYIPDYYPYHYCRRKGSMLGSYKPETIRKFTEVKNELYVIADLKGYKFKEQITLNFTENLLVALKKIMVDMQYDRHITKQYLMQICDMQDVKAALGDRKILQRFGVKEKLMAALLRMHWYDLCIYLSRFANMVMKGPTI